MDSTYKATVRGDRMSASPGAAVFLPFPIRFNGSENSERIVTSLAELNRAARQ